MPTYVIQDLILSSIPFHGISILELSSYSSVSCGNGNPSCKHATRLQHNGTSDPRQSTVYKGSCRRLDILVRLGVDARVFRQHVDMRDFDMIEK